MTSRSIRGIFHRDSSRIDAERILQQTKIRGAFLLRWSRSKTDGFVLSVRRNSREIAHLPICRTDEKTERKLNNERFSTVFDLIEYYYRKRNELRDKNNEPIELNAPIVAQLPTEEKYYHGGITHAQVISLLESSDDIGSFLVRDSETNPGEYVICLKTNDEITNIKIKNNKGLWFLAGVGHSEEIDRFKSLDDLIHFYIKHNILIGVNRVSLRLGSACLTNWFYFRQIQQRCETLSKIVTTSEGPKSGFALEFDWVNQQSQFQSARMSKRHGEKNENRGRNRFRNIVPFDTTRVVLKNYPMTDYVNGSRIKSPFENNQREYIAAQGPLPTTINDFWQMISQESVTCIVMITKEIENARNKCARYWPEVNNKIQYGNVTVENLNETNFVLGNGSRPVRALGPGVVSDFDCSFRIRSLKITNEEGKQWEIGHFQYLSWTDHDSPLATDQRDKSQLSVLVEFFKRFSFERPTNFPIVVHCSAGIGRSGATIAIDILLHRIENEGLNAEIDVPFLIKFLRSQRCGLVQNERQYELIYRIVEFIFEQSQFSRPNLKS